MSAENLRLNTFSETDVAEIRALAGPIVILGAGGFIGSHCFHQLLSFRDDVFAGGQNLGSNWRLSWLPEEIKSRHFFDFDIVETGSVHALFEKIRPQTVFNFCAYGAYENQTNSNRIHEVNYLGVLNLLRTMEKFPVKAFVNSGSSSEYGLNCKAPKEDDELLPNSEYAVAKGAAGSLIRYFALIKGIPAAHLRLYSVYGPWEDPGRLMPNLVERGLEQAYPNFVAPQTSRDFVYVDDCLRAYVKSAHLCATKPGAVFNVGTGKPTTIAEVAQQAKRLFNVNADPQFGSMPPRRWDLTNWYADPTAMTQALQWKPETNLEKGLQLTTQWEQNFRSRGLIKQAQGKAASYKKISAVIACYRDHLAIPIMYERLVSVFKKCQLDYEIIFVNDCSPTGDGDVIRRLVDDDSHVVGISHSRNFGSQAAFLSGMEIATGDAVVLFDGDLQDPPELVENFVAKWKQGYDVVYGVRERRQAPLYMQFFYRIFYRIFRSLADIPIPLDAGDFSLIDRKVVQEMLSLGERDFFLRGLRAWVGFKQVGVSYVRPERMFGVTTNNFAKNIWWAKKGIFSFSVKPLDYVQRIGLLTCLGSFLLGGFYFIYYFVNTGQAPKGITTILILTLGMGGLQILAISVIGEYIKKIMEEVKGRPRYIRSEVYKNREKFGEPH